MPPAVSTDIIWPLLHSILILWLDKELKWSSFINPLLFASPFQDNQRRQQMEEERSTARDNYDDDEEDDSEDDGFIVDDDGVPITSKRKQKKHKFADA